MFFVTSAPAPTIEWSPITALSKIMEPMPIRQPSPIVQAWIIAPWPIVVFLPILTPASSAKWTIVPS